MIKLIRIPILLILLLAAGALLPRYLRETMLFDVVGALGPWILLLLIGVAFIVIADAGRDRRHPAWLLTAEIVVASLIVIVPQVVWGQVLTTPSVVTRALGTSSGSVFAQMLSLFWLVVAVRTGLRQRRGRKQTAAHGTSD